jgi:hypothetical protein
MPVARICSTFFKLLTYLAFDDIGAGSRGEG